MLIFKDASAATFTLYGDFISINKVLEHIANPNKTIEILSKMLSRNGFLYIEVPDQISSRYGKNREELMVEHLHVFSKKSLTNLIIKHNLTPIEVNQILEPSGKFTIFGFFKKMISIATDFE